MHKLVQQGIIRTRFDAWRTELSEDVGLAIEGEFAETLEADGYSPYLRVGKTDKELQASLTRAKRRAAMMRIRHFIFTGMHLFVLFLQQPHQVFFRFRQFFIMRSIIR